MTRRFHVYKVIEINENRLFSAMSYVNMMGYDPDSDTFIIEYFLHKYVEAKIGMLFAFKTLKFAQGFHKGMDWKGLGERSPYQLWECLTTIKPKPFGGTIIPSGKENFEYFWNHFPDRYRSNFMVYSMPAPKDTILCNDLKLWKQII